ncbi:MAG: acetylxylan esterase [Acidobacteria bacterium]|nr:MAG: acetylxylan esterase [Acidobacteriota bacterium]
MTINLRNVRSSALVDVMKLQRILLTLLLCVTAAAERPIKDEQSWRKRRGQILSSMQKVMGPLPDGAASPPAVTVLDEVSFPQFIRRKIEFASGDGDRVPAYLFLPRPAKLRGPAMLCLHQTVAIGKGEPAGIGGKPNLHYGVELAERGYVVLAPDYPNFGDYKIDAYSLGYASATMKGIRNHRRAVDLLVSLPEVDPRRIGVIGHSLGGHNSLFLAAFEPRIGAVVTSCGFTSFRKYYGGNLTGWSHAGYMPRIATVYGKSPERMPFDFSDVLFAIAPRPVFINAPLHDQNFEWTGVDDCLRSAQPVYARIFHAPSGLQVVHPDCAHDFPPDIRNRAYEFLDRSLAPTAALKSAHD